MRRPEWLEGKGIEEIGFRILVVVFWSLIAGLIGSFLVFVAIAAWQSPGVASIVAGIILFVIGVAFFSFYVEHKRK